jgi:hypothetical protein
MNRHGRSLAAGALQPDFSPGREGNAASGRIGFVLANLSSMQFALLDFAPIYN